MPQKIPCSWCLLFWQVVWILLLDCIILLLLCPVCFMRIYPNLLVLSPFNQHPSHLIQGHKGSLYTPTYAPLPCNPAYIRVPPPWCYGASSAVPAEPYDDDQASLCRQESLSQDITPTTCAVDWWAPSQLKSFLPQPQNHYVRSTLSRHFPADSIRKY